MPNHRYKKVTVNTFGFLIFGPAVMSFLLLVFAVGYYSFTNVNPYDQPFLVYFVFSLIIAMFVNSFIEYQAKGYYFTKDSVCFKQGFWNAKSTTIPFLKIDSASLNQNVFQKIFGVCSVVFEQGEGDENFDDVSVVIGHNILTQVSKKSGKVKISS